MIRRLASAVVLTIALAAPAGAQRYVSRADSLLRQGRVFAAESLYYYAVKKTPRDPAARLALGRYLAARGALKIGASVRRWSFHSSPSALSRPLPSPGARTRRWRSSLR